MTRVYALLLCICMLAACSGGGGGGGGSGGGGVQGSGTVGPTGGTVTGPNGASVVIPPGALATEITITIEQTTGGAPALPAGTTTYGAMYAFMPHGTSFALPVTLTVPFDPAQLPTGVTPVLYKTDATQTGWEIVAGATVNGATMVGQVSGFSYLVAGSIPSLVRNDPERTWWFNWYHGDGTTSVFSEGGPLVGGDFERVVNFGSTLAESAAFRTLTQSFAEDYVANGHVFGSADGVTYAALAEAPDGRVGTSDPIGSSSNLFQSQSFIKRADDARLTFTLTRVIIIAEDMNPPILAGSPLVGKASYLVHAQRGTEPLFYKLSGIVSVFGANEAFSYKAETMSDSHLRAWDDDDFNFNVEVASQEIEESGLTCVGTRATLTLKQPITYSVDLSSIQVGEEFTVYSTVYVDAINRRGGGSRVDCQVAYVGAFLRDPSEISGVALDFTGLEPTNRPVPMTPSSTQPVSCSTAPNPAAGTLQFAAPYYVVEEYAGAVPVVTVTRTGGSSGPVSVNFATRDGSAIGGTDYTPRSTTVLFGDGDSGARVVEIPITPDTIGEFGETIELTLSAPGGCASLGTQTSAVLTVRDDDTLSTAGALDLTFSTDGKASIPIFGGDESGMALQADGKIVMVGGTFTDFVLARFDTVGNLDTSFSTDGKVTTDIAGGFADERARAVAIHPDDGRIVVVGEARQPAAPFKLALAMARYMPNGDLDPTFGNGGIVFDSALTARAFAVAVDPDGNIVVAGDYDRSGNGVVNTDFFVARYTRLGQLDATFGVGGIVVTDLGGVDLARNVLLQPLDHKIVVSGDSIDTSTSPSTLLPTPVVRYDASGQIDPGFGAGGVARLANTSNADLGQGLALQRDGKLLCVGSAYDRVNPTKFAVMRLTDSGGIDATFDTDGLVTTSITDQGDFAYAVAVQGDRILVAGEGNRNGVNTNFELIRYNADGSVDTTFASGGRLEIDFFGRRDVAENVAVQPTGKIVLGGVVTPSGADGYGVAQVMP